MAERPARKEAAANPRNSSRLRVIFFPDKIGIANLIIPKIGDWEK
jgi:hypothetical protein